MAIILLKNLVGKLWKTNSARCLAKQTSAEICFSGDYIVWKNGGVAISTMRAYLGDLIKNIDTTTVCCYYADNNGNLTERWRVTATASSNTTIFKYIGTPYIINFSWTLNSLTSKTVVAQGITRQKQKYAVNITAGAGWTNVYTSSVSSVATSGNSSGYEYDYGTRVYYFAETTITQLENYDLPYGSLSTVYESGDVRRYCIGSVLVMGTKSVSIKALVPKPITIYFDGVATLWSSNGSTVNYLTAYYGDYLSVTGSTVICKYPSGVTRWTVAASLMTDTVEWDFGGAIALPYLEDTQITSIMTISSTGGTATRRKYSVSLNGASTEGITSVFLAADSAATSGYSSGTTFEYGSTIYAIAKVLGTNLGTYSPPDSWEYQQIVDSYYYYVIGSLGKVTDDVNKNLIYYEGLGELDTTCTITFAGNYVSWTSATKEALIGDSLLVSDNAVICKRNTVELWRNTATIYADTAQYDYGGSLKILAPTEVANDIVITADGATRTTKKYAVNIVAPDWVIETYTSTSNTATAGNASGYQYNYNTSTIIYGFVKVESSYGTNLYDLSASGWSAIYTNGQYTWYRIGSTVVDGANLINGAKVITAPTLIPRTFAATFVGDYVTWSATSKPIQTGDIIIANGDTVTCTSADGTAKWTVTATKLEDTDLYTYSGTPSAFINNVGTTVIEGVTGDVTIGDVGVTRITEKYTVTLSSSRVGIQNAWLSTSSSATSGSTTLNVPSGTTVYGFAVLSGDIQANLVANKTLISGTACKQGAIYIVNSKTVTATTTLDIELFNTNNLESTILFTRSGASAGTWTINEDVVQSADSYGYFSKSGYTINFTGPDYAGSDITVTVATFTCPDSYTATLTMIDADGNSVAWNNAHYLNGPYTIEAETEYAPQAS